MKQNKQPLRFRKAKLNKWNTKRNLRKVTLCLNIAAMLLTADFERVSYIVVAKYYIGVTTIITNNICFVFRN